MVRIQSPLFHNKYRVLSSRRPGWDYSDAAHYFVTIVTGGRRNYFGDVQNGEMILSTIGNIVHEEWVKTGEIRKDYVRLDEWIIMPNHIHAIIEIVETPRWGVLAGQDGMSDNPHRPDNADAPAGRLYSEPPLKNSKNGSNRFWQPYSLGSIINQFKSTCTKIIHTNIDSTFTWQPRYHDRIIRDEFELNRIRKYIRENSMKWEEDELFTT